MGFKDKYTTDKIAEPEKAAVSSESYLQAEMLEELAKAIHSMAGRMNG